MIALKIAQARARVQEKERVDLISSEPCVLWFSNVSFLGYRFTGEVKQGSSTESPFADESAYLGASLTIPCSDISMNTQSISPLLHATLSRLIRWLRPTLK